MTNDQKVATRSSSTPELPAVAELATNASSAQADSLLVGLTPAVTPQGVANSPKKLTCRGLLGGAA